MNNIHNTKFSVANCSVCNDVYRFKKKEEQWAGNYVEYSSFYCRRCCKLIEQRENLEKRLLNNDWLLFTLKHNRPYLDE